MYFPYTYIYPEQYSYMLALKRSLDANGPCVLEMPSGTGKTVSLLSLITSYQLAHPEVGKLVYCSRTVPEIEKAVEELRRVVAYRDQELGDDAPKFLGLALSARRNLCIHPQVSQHTQGVVVDSKCRGLTSSWVRAEADKYRGLHEETTDGQGRRSVGPVELCDFFEEYEKNGRDVLLNGVYSLGDLKQIGRERGWCPYFLARHLINFSHVVIYSYQYIIDPKISDLVSKEFKKNSIVVFDEAHNIDNVCIDALSVNIDKRILGASARSVKNLSTNITRIKATDADKLKKEYNRLVEGLSGIARIADEAKADPVLPDDVIQEVIPANIRKAEDFIDLLKRFLQYLQARLNTKQVISEPPLAFLQSCQEATKIVPKTLRFCAGRLSSLLRALEISDTAEYQPLGVVCDFATLLGTYQKGFSLIIEPRSDEEVENNTILQYTCLDASIAMQPIIRRFRSVVITSGTLSPLDMYPRMLNFMPVVTERLGMSLNRACVCPLIVTRGSDQEVISTKFEGRRDPSVLRNYGALLLQFTTVVPDGMVCFFPSYRYMEETVSVWDEIGILRQVVQHKLLFVETPDSVESSLALSNYRRACDTGRGAILFSVARGKISEGIDFDHHYGRCVILFGIPYMNTQSRILRARLEFLRDNYQIQEAEFLTFDAMRTAAQCVGRVIRGKKDYGIMVWADKRYNRLDKRSKMPQWVSDNLQHSHLNLSTEMAVSLARTFLKEMAQPFSLTAQLGKALWTLEMVEKQPTSKKPTHIALTTAATSPSYEGDDQQHPPSSSSSSST